MSKWESKWKKSLLSEQEQKTEEEALDYIRCMTITQNVDPIVYQSLSKKLIQEIKDYMDDPMTATKFYKADNKKEVYGKKKVKHTLLKKFTIG